MVASLAAAAVLVLVLAGLSFAWAGRSGRALEPVPANPTTSATIGAAFTSQLQQWIDALPAGAPPSTPYWHDGTLYVNGEQIPAPYAAVDIKVAGDTVLVAGYESEAKDAAPSQWGLVRGDRLEPLPVPAGTRDAGLSVDGRIAYWVDTRCQAPSSSSPGTPRPTPPWPRAPCTATTVELWGIDAAGNGYWQTELTGTTVTRWDVRANTTHPTDLTYAGRGPRDVLRQVVTVDAHRRTRTVPRTAPRGLFTDSVPWTRL